MRHLCGSVAPRLARTMFVTACLVGLLTGLGLGSASAQDAEGQADAVVIYLVRHAERADDGTRDPPLSEDGRARVRALRHVLADAAITHVHTTDLKRTRDTAQPVADDHGVSLSIYDPFDLAGFAASLRATPGNHLVSGHSNTTPSLVQALGGDPRGEVDEGEYDRLYVVVVSPSGPAVTTLLRYGEPSGG